ncbi:MAG: glycine--tRNA ligase subunit beta [Fusobacteriaceae bacterium]|jgi:glycyl-tRNA synthetase beta chain|nr:glycine--tRNA ligase subunit beta [Fusobacteriaceae bacterium]
MRLLFELGMEEIPARFLRDALKEMKTKLSDTLKAERIAFEEARTYGTPRRLVLEVTGLAELQSDLDTVNLGPARHIAYDSNGAISKAGLGFVKSQGLKVSEIEIITTPKGEYIGARKFVKGKPVRELLPEILKNLVLSLTFPKSMRWADKKIRFARPIQWFLALLDNEVVKFSIEGIESDNKSRGHRFFGRAFEAADIDDYFKKIRENHVIIDIDERKRMIREMVKGACVKKEQVVIEDDLLEEVTNLVEAPYAIVGSFNSDFLEVPQEVLIISMEVHQRYFPILDEKGKLLPKFIVIRNGVGDSAEVRKGNEKVLSARLADARFFYTEDLKRPLSDNVEKLKTVVFQKDLGTIWDKIVRMEKTGRYVIEKLGLEVSSKDILRTIYLAKADLVSDMIGEKEFTKLQGFMGADYARKSGEGDKVATGIEEHYYPRFTGDRLPEGVEGAVTGLVDRLDTLAGCFGVGVIPSGSKDPFALRRAALGIVNIILNAKMRLSLRELCAFALKVLAETGVLKRESDEVLAEVLEFFAQRAVNIFSELRYGKDVISAVLTVTCDDLVRELEKVETLDSFVKSPDFGAFLPILKRVGNISRDFGNPAKVNPAWFEKDIEMDLYAFTENLREQTAQNLAKGDYAAYFASLLTGKDVVNAYFEQVMVNAEDETIRNNRLSQVKTLADIFSKVADLNLIEEK